jgi:ribosome-binding factor A
MAVKRTDRLNSLLREVISDVIRKEVKNPIVSDLTTVTKVDITSDLCHAKVYVSVMGDLNTKKNTLHALKKASGFIAVKSSKLVVMRRFPDLMFKLDDSVDKHMRVEELLQEIKNKESKSDTTKASKEDVDDEENDLDTIDDEEDGEFEDDEEDGEFEDDEEDGEFEDDEEDEDDK